jgi:putative DNA primase/helicase
MGAADCIEQFKDAMRRRSLVPPDQLHGDGRLHRCDAEGRTGRSDGSYLLHLDDGLPAGGLQNWRDGLGWEVWRAHLGRQLTDVEQAQHRVRAEAMRAQRAAEEAQRHAAAAMKAQRIWDAADPRGALLHRYVVEKRIQPYGARVDKHDLVVPIRNVRGELVSVQRIAPDGRKRNLTGGQLEAAFLLLGDVAGSVLVFAEGYATGCSLKEALPGTPVIVAFGAGNLLAAGRALRAMYTTIKFVFAADDDAGEAGNPGMTKAAEAAQAVGGVVLAPCHAGKPLAGGGDWNDLHCRHGLEAVRAALAAGLVAAGDGHSAAGAPTTSTSNMQQDGVALYNGQDVTPKALRWVWEGWLPLGKLAILAGAPGVGKSTAAASFAACVTSGIPFPDGAKCKPANVIVWSAEDDVADTVLPRLIAAGADRARVYFVSGTRIGGAERSFDPASDLDLLAQEARAVGDVGLLVVDPVVSVVGGDSHKATEVRRALQPLVDLAVSLDCAVLGISHFSKGTAGRDPIERVTGSIAFTAVARSLMVAAEAKDADGREYRVLAMAKSNLAASRRAFEFSTDVMELPEHPGVTASLVRWGPAVDGTARELLSEDAEAKERRAGAVDLAEAFLRNLLGSGPVTSDEVAIKAAAAGHSAPSTRRAADRIGVEKVKPRKGEPGFPGWIWRLPTKVITPPYPAQVEQDEQLEQVEQIDEAQLVQGVQHAQVNQVAQPVHREQLADVEEF